MKRSYDCRGLILVVVLCLGPGSAEAARVDDLYAAEAPANADSSSDLAVQFREALGRVLVKITGQRGVDVAGLGGQLAQPDRMVQQYRTNPDGSTWVMFDGDALRRSLDAAGLASWGEERPATLVWLILDSGGGQREVLSAASSRRDRRSGVRSALLQTANERGLPIILPIGDSEEISAVSIRDVWGGFTGSLQSASDRYRADAILVGRARLRSSSRADVRWTLLLGDERIEWNGSISNGPERSADIFVSRLATSGNNAGQLLLQVDQVDSLAAYGRLSQYLNSLDGVDNFAVDQVNESTIVFSLTIRGEIDRLMRAIALRRVLQPADNRITDPGLSTDPVGMQRAALHYSLIGGP